MEPRVNDRMLYHDGSGRAPMAAFVCYVWPNASVNLAVFGHDGKPLAHPPTNVYVATNDAAACGGQWCTFADAELPAVEAR